MRPVESEQVIEHIEDAKSWLNKACDEYGQANPVRGEIILNLAQAEVKHAWELSHQQFVIHGSQQTAPRVRWNYLLPAAAVLLLIVGLLSSGLLNKVFNFNNGSSLSRQPATTATGVDPTRDPNHPTTVANLTSEKLKPVATPLNGENSRNNLAGNNTSEGSRIPGQNGPRVQPVTEILIDEEALTREASHTLQDGK